MVSLYLLYIENKNIIKLRFDNFANSETEPKDSAPKLVLDAESIDLLRGEENRIEEEEGRAGQERQE